MILHYEIRFCTTGYDSVLRDTILFYRIRFCITGYDSVLQDTILYYEIRFCTRHTILYYDGGVTGYDSVNLLNSISF
jgi:hypothetical protein